jgi:membrane protein DedA with SNARE-associated domain
MKGFMYLLFVLLYAGVTFFGLGPVLFADGSMQERMITLAVVIVIYVVLTVLLVAWRRWSRSRSSR